MLVTRAVPRQLAHHPEPPRPAADERDSHRPGRQQQRRRRPVTLRSEHPERRRPAPVPVGGAGRPARTRKARPPRSEPWAVRALIKARTIEHRLQVAQLSHQNDPAGQVTAQTVLGLLAMARQACQERHGPLAHWWGTSAERAYRSLHEAEALLIDLVSLDEVDAAVSKARARALTALKPGDPRRDDAEELPRLPRGPAKRLRLRNVMAASYAAADEAHGRLRDFRNVLCVTAVLVAIMTGLFVILIAVNPSMVPFCFTPSPRHRVCPAGGPGPAGGDVVLVAGLGLLGGILAAAFAVRNIRGTSTPYDIPIALAVLKAPTGALTAVTGLLLLRGQFVPGLSALDSQQQILAYALVLGYAQQIFTHFVDRQAQSVLDSVPGKGAGTQPPGLPPASPPARSAQATAAAAAAPAGPGPDE
jgi:hypothetical protein